MSTYSSPQKFAAFDKGRDFAKNLRRAWTRVRLMEKAEEHKQVKFPNSAAQPFTAVDALQRKNPKQAEINILSLSAADTSI